MTQETFLLSLEAAGFRKLSRTYVLKPLKGIEIWVSPNDFIIVNEEYSLGLYIEKGAEVILNTRGFKTLDEAWEAIVRNIATLKETTL